MPIRVIYNHCFRGSSFERNAEFFKYLSKKKITLSNPSTAMASMIYKKDLTN